jgi:hypothetical protein
MNFHINPSIIDETTRRLDFRIYANNTEVTGQLLSESPDYLEITSAYGIYYRITNKTTIHTPYSVVLQHLMR